MKSNLNKMIALSKEKKILLNKILDSTEKQKKAIEEDDLDALALVLDHKEEFMKEIDTMDIEFLELYTLLKEKEGIESFDEINVEKYDNVKDLKDIVSSINDILTDISKKDKENTKLMKSSINNIKLDIKNVKKGQKAYKGYNQENRGSMLIDEKK